MIQLSPPLELIWRYGSARLRLWLADLQSTFTGVQIWEGTKIPVPAMAARWHDVSILHCVHCILLIRGLCIVQNNRVCRPGYQIWDYYPSALSFCQVMSTHLKIGHPQILSFGAWSSNKLLILYCLSWRRDDSPSNRCQGLLLLICCKFNPSMDQ